MSENDELRARAWHAFSVLLLLGGVEFKRTERNGYRLLLKRPKDESVESFTGDSPEEALSLAAQKYLTLTVRTEK